MGKPGKAIAENPEGGTRPDNPSGKGSETSGRGSGKDPLPDPATGDPIERESEVGLHQGSGASSPKSRRSGPVGWKAPRMRREAAKSADIRPRNGSKDPGDPHPPQSSPVVTDPRKDLREDPEKDP